MVYTLKCIEPGGGRGRGIEPRGGEGEPWELGEED
jgi:hypothetical protein